MSGNDQAKYEEIIKKIQDGNTSFLILAGFFLIVPVVAILVLTSQPKGTKKISQEKIRSMSQRKNVFNFGTKETNGSMTGPQTGSSNESSNWFSSARTPEQIVEDQLSAAMQKIERNYKVEAPSYLEGNDKLFYEAEKNYFICTANGLMEEGRYDEVEDYLKKALDYDSGNPFVEAKVYELLSALYAKLGDMAKSEEFAKKYIDMIDKLPEGFADEHLKQDIRNTYKMMESLHKYSNSSLISESFVPDESNEAGIYPDPKLLEGINNSFPIKIE